LFVCLKEISMSIYDLITLSSDCSFVTKSTEKNCVPKSYRNRVAHFAHDSAGYWSRNTYAMRSFLITHACNVTPVYKIIDGPDGGSLLFSRRWSLPERFVSRSLDDPFKSVVGAIRIAMILVSDGKLWEEETFLLLVYSSRLAILWSFSFAGYQTKFERGNTKFATQFYF